MVLPHRLLGTSRTYITSRLIYMTNTGRLPASGGFSSCHSYGGANLNYIAVPGRGVLLEDMGGCGYGTGRRGGHMEGDICRHSL